MFQSLYVLHSTLFMNYKRKNRTDTCSKTFFISMLRMRSEIIKNRTKSLKILSK